MFHFKKFSIEDSDCAMKIGTDGVLIAAWSKAHNPISILDIGAGSGIIALIAAQRFILAEQVDGLEIDPKAFEQCVSNFEQSPWNDRLFCYHAGIEEFTQEMSQELNYDLIISNPPFFDNSHSSKYQERDLSRSASFLDENLLFSSVKELLSANGFFNVIYPYNKLNLILKVAKKHNLHPKYLTKVKGSDETEFKRVLIAFSKEPPCTDSPVIDELTIEHQRHNYSDKYKELTKDFYLNLK